MRAFRRYAAVTVAMAVLAMTGCTGSSEDEPSGGPSAESAEKVTYLTAFNTFGREAYAYVAKEKGYFTEAGLDVDIKVGNGSGENMAALAAGQADFAPVDSTGYMIYSATGKVEGITAVGAIQQRSMVGLMTLDGYGIKTPRDLEGKTIGDPSGATTGILFPTYAKLAGIDASKVKFQNVDSSQVAGALAQHKVDAIGQFTVGEPLIEKAAGGKSAVALPMSDVITDLYGHFLLTSKESATDKPDRAKKFTAALIKGLDYAIANPAEAGKILNQAVPTMDPEVAAKELEIMGSYTKGAAPKLGIVEVDRVARIIAILEGSSAIPAGKEPQDFVTLDLIPTA